MAKACIKKLYTRLQLLMTLHAPAQLHIVTQPRFRQKPHYVKLTTFFLARTIKMQEKSILNSERTFKIKERSGLKFRLRRQLFAFEELCMEKRLSNIYKTTNVTKMTKGILKSCYRVLQESSCLMSYMILEEKYFTDYILLTDQMSLSSSLFFVKYQAVCVL